MSIKDSEPVPLVNAQHFSEGSYYSAKQLLDLRLMHHYCVSTTQCFASVFPDGILTSLRVDIPQLALQHEFLMDAVLLVAMVHLGCSDPVALEGLPVCLYRDQALGGLRRAVANITPQNMDAIRSSSVLLATVSFAADRITGCSGLWVLNWLTLAFGQRNFRCPRDNAALFPRQGNGSLLSSLYGSFTDVTAPEAIPTDILTALANEQGNIDSAERDALYNASQQLGRLITTLEHPYEQSWLEKKIKAWSFDVVPSGFLTMTREKNPLALIILAHYLILFKLLPNLWVYEGLANHDIEMISRTLGQGWEQYIAAPKMALQTEDASALVDLLTRCLRGRV